MISIARPTVLAKLLLGRIGLAAVLLAAIIVAAPLAGCLSMEQQIEAWQSQCHAEGFD